MQISIEIKSRYKTGINFFAFDTNLRIGTGPLVVYNQF